MQDINTAICNLQIKMTNDTFAGKKGKNLNELKQELEIDVHRVSVDELCKRFNSNVAEGLTDDQVFILLVIELVITCMSNRWRKESRSMG